MARLAIPMIVSGLLHAGLLYASRNIEQLEPQRASHPVAMRVIEPPPPEPAKEPEPEPEPKAEPKPKLAEKPKVVRRPSEKKANEAAPPPSSDPPSKKPAPPPTGFSIDMSSTVVGGGGPAVAAVEGGGNMFADPSQKQLPPGKKSPTRVAPPSGDGDDPQGGAQVTTTRPPKFLGDESSRRPPYPEAARAQRVEGQVVLRVFVNAAGRVAKVKVVKSLGYGTDEAATEHAKKTWRFEPAIRGTTPIGMWITVSVTFVLEE